MLWGFIMFITFSDCHYVVFEVSISHSSVWTDPTARDLLSHDTLLLREKEMLIGLTQVHRLSHLNI